MSKVDVAAIREKLSKATEGPWSIRDHFYVDADATVDGDHLWVGETEFTRDAELIVLLRNSIEALLDENDRLRRAFDAKHESLIDAEDEVDRVRALAEAQGIQPWSESDDIPAGDLPFSSEESQAFLREVLSIRYSNKEELNALLDKIKSERRGNAD